MPGKDALKQTLRNKLPSMPPPRPPFRWYIPVVFVVLTVVWLFLLLQVRSSAAEKHFKASLESARLFNWHDSWESIEQACKIREEARYLFHKATLLNRGVADNHNPQQANEIAKQAIPTLQSNHDKISLYYLGYAYQTGLGVDINLDQAITWYTKAAEQKHPNAMLVLGELFQSQKKDTEQAKKWYSLAAKGGNSKAMKYIGDLELRNKNDDKAKEWYSKSAQQGYSQGMIALGNLYNKGRGVEQDFNKAVQWYSKAVNKGDTDAMVHLAQMYLRGDGVAHDYDRARRWLQKAADAGSGEAMAQLGLTYEKGRGVRRDFEMARFWYSRGARANNSNALYAAARLHIQGKGGEKDYDQALEYLKQAAKLGHKGAAKKLSELQK